MTEIRLKMKQFYVHLSGCMFAGKTDTIRSILNKYALGRTNKLKCLHTKFDIDDRYTADDRVLTHSGGVIEKNEELTIDVMVIPCKPDSLLNLKTEGYDVICVDELHFMCDPSDALDERACDLLESFVARIVFECDSPGDNPLLWYRLSYYRQYFYNFCHPLTGIHYVRIQETELCLPFQVNRASTRWREFSRVHHRSASKISIVYLVRYAAHIDPHHVSIVR